MSDPYRETDKVPAKPTPVSPYRVPAREASKWYVVARQSIFLPEFVLGRWDSRWWAILVGWWYTVCHEHSEVHVFKGWVEDRVVSFDRS